MTYRAAAAKIVGEDGGSRLTLPVKPPGVPWHKVDDLTARQVAAMDRLANAVRAAKVTDEEAVAIEQMIRDGHVPGALKRITQAGRRTNE